MNDLPPNLLIIVITALVSVLLTSVANNFIACENKSNVRSKVAVAVMIRCLSVHEPSPRAADHRWKFRDTSAQWRANFPTHGEAAIATGIIESSV